MRWLLVLASLATLAMPGLGAAQVQIKDDQFSPSATFIGPSRAVNPFGGTFRMWMLRSWVNKSDHSVTHQLYVDTSYLYHWRFWNQATDDHAGIHPVDKIDSQVIDCSGGCDYTETVGVELDDSFVRQHADGFEIKVTSQSGDYLSLPVSADQIRPVLDAIDAYERNAGWTSQPSPQSATGRASEAPGASAPPAPGNAVVLGIQFADLPPALAGAMGRPGLQGAFVVTIAQGSVAQRSGLQVGDVVTAYGGRPIAGKDDLIGAVRSTSPGDSVLVSLLRAGKDAQVTLNYGVTAQPANAQPVAPPLAPAVPRVAAPSTDPAPLPAPPPAEQHHAQKCGVIQMDDGVKIVPCRAAQSALR